MQESLALLDTYHDHLVQHRLYNRIREPRHEDLRRQFDSFVPIFNFIVTFPYYNEQYVIGPEARGNGCLAKLTAALTHHALEDRTHAQLFLQDFDRLELGKLWCADQLSLLLWSLWVSPALGRARRVSSRRVAGIVDPVNQWPPFKYLHVEQIEKDGNALFSASAAVARQIEPRLGELVYFGNHHLEREPGILCEHDGYVNDVQLGPAELEQARAIVEEKHRLSVEMNDVMAAFADQAAERGAAAIFASERRASMEAVAEKLAGPLPPDPLVLRPRASGPQARLVEAWDEHFARFKAHPFGAAMEEVGRESPAFALRCASVLFAHRIASLHGLYHDDCQDRLGSDAESGVVRAIASCFATEARIFFHDWEALELDAKLPWRCGDFLEWSLFDPRYGRPELQALHEMRRWVLNGKDDPLVKYWAILAVHFMSRAFFDAAAPIARLHRELFPDRPRLVYLEGIHHLFYGEAIGDLSVLADHSALLDRPVTPEQERYILDLLRVFAECGIQQFDNLHAALTHDRGRFASLK